MPWENRCVDPNLRAKKSSRGLRQVQCKGEGELARSPPKNASPTRPGPPIFSSTGGAPFSRPASSEQSTRAIAGQGAPRPKAGRQVGQTSPGKDADLRHTTPTLTSGAETTGFAVLCQLTSPRRPRMRFLFMGLWLSHSLPPDVWSPSRPWLLVVLCFIVSSHRGLEPLLIRAHAGRTQGAEVKRGQRHR